jgi:hypothetical protein
MDAHVGKVVSMKERREGGEIYRGICTSMMSLFLGC